MAWLHDVELGLDSCAREQEGAFEWGPVAGSPGKRGGHLCGKGAGGPWACAGGACVLPVQLWTFLQLRW